LVSAIGVPASCICKAGFQAGPEYLRQRMPWANPILARSVFGYFHIWLAPDYAE
jgi:hypothetical protein